MLNLNKLKMKKITLSMMIIVLSLSVIPTTMLAKATEPTSISSTKEMPAEVKVMLNRLEEIKDMDKSNLTSSDKKALRKEVRAIKSNLKASGNGIYLSIGAILIIILILILIL